MTENDVIAALQLPSSARLDKRVPKKALIENGAPTPADKRLLNDRVEEVEWVAVLKPETVGLAALSNDALEYREIVVLRLLLRSDVGLKRLLALVHRAIPYPVLLVARCCASTGRLRRAERSVLSLAHKRRSQGEAGTFVLAHAPCALSLDRIGGEVAVAFLQSMAIPARPAVDMFALYQGWVDSCDAVEASALTGTFVLPSSPAHAEERRQVLALVGSLSDQIASLHKAASKERQLARQVDVNLKLKRLQAERAALIERL